MLKLFRGPLMGARRDPMTSKRGNKAFYKGKSVCLDTSVSGYSCKILIYSQNFTDFCVV